MDYGEEPSCSNIAMTQLSPTLSIRRMAVYAGGKTVYDEPFHSGVNIIRGDNGSGKSTITDFLFFGLGGDVSAWKPEAQSCDEVLVEVGASDQPVTLRREVSTSRRQGMRIFWGDMDRATKSASSGWQLFPFQRSGSKESFSQVFFRAIGLPDVQSDATGNITMHQILRLIYVDQLSSVEDVLRTEQFDSPLTREAVRDLLFGVYDDSLYRHALDLREKKREVDTVRIEYNSTVSVLRQAEQELDMEKLAAELATTRQQISETSAEIDRATSREVDLAQGEDEVDTPRLSAVLEGARREKNAADKEIRELELNVEDSRDFITALENRLVALAESATTRDVFGELPLLRCPHCLAPLQESTSSDTCLLCKEPLAKTDGKAHLLRIRQELIFQKRESEALLKSKEEKLRELRARLPLLEDRARALQHDYDSSVRPRTTRDHRLDALLMRKGWLESRLETLHEQAKAGGIVDHLKARMGELASEIERLELDIQTKRQSQEKRNSEAREVVQMIARGLLHADLPREEAFQSAHAVSVDFRNNKFSIDGRDQFSASSLCYLKNCIHYAILFASLQLPYFRYPRLIVCDNMEDKGMEEIRSQNFQRVIVERSREDEIEHQIIFTTSMIDPELDGSELCVGRYYTLAEKSLEV